MRRWLSVPCEGERLAAALDEASGSIGVLMVSGGTELACGAHAGMATVAAELARRGLPVLRFDRRGVGDSTGADPGYQSSAPDIQAALTCMRTKCPELSAVIGVGNCDGATALLLAEAGLQGLVLSNVWLERPIASDGTSALPRAAVRSHYRHRLRSPAAWVRLLTGAVELPRLFRSLQRLQGGPDHVHQLGLLARRMRDTTGPITVLLASKDATAIGFADALRQPALRNLADAVEVIRYPSRSHSFASAADQAVLVNAIMVASRQQKGR